MPRNQIQGKTYRNYGIKPRKVPAEVENTLYELASYTINLTYIIMKMDINEFFESEALRYLLHLVDQVDYTVDTIAYDLKERDQELYDTIKGIYPLLEIQLKTARERLQKNAEKVKADIILTLTTIASTILYILVRW